MTIALSIDNLSLMRGGRLVLRAESRHLAGGSVLALEGPNGAGKTSLLRALGGFLDPYTGSITLTRDGAALRDGEERARAIGWLSHLDAVKPQLSVREQAVFWATVFGYRGDVLPVLERVGLMALASRRGQLLSAGQKRRLALARLILSERPLWLLDEPTAALDIAGKALVAEVITAHAAAGGIVIAATHEGLGVTGEKLVLGAA